MPYGLVDIQRSLDNSAKLGLKDAANLEKQREQAWEQIEQADDASLKSSVGMGIGTGATIGMTIGPGGAVAGALIGGAAGYLTHKFF